MQTKLSSNKRKVQRRPTSTSSSFTSHTKWDGESIRSHERWQDCDAAFCPRRYGDFL